MIISLPWLRTPRVQRLLDEVLDPSVHGPSFFDLMIVDEAHHCAPTAPARGRRGYAVDSLQTKAVRRMSQHSQHRILLSATPHNGYRESWQALLEIVDPRRFERGIEPDPTSLREVLVRRLKDEIRTADDRPEFAERLPAEPLEVDYTDSERRGHDLLASYTELRTGSPRRNDLVTLLLKKRLFSSPAAFAKTLDQHAKTVRGLRAVHDDDPWTAEYDFADEPDDAAGSEAEAALFVMTATGLTAAAERALEELITWAHSQVGPVSEVLATGGTTRAELARLVLADALDWREALQEGPQLPASLTEIVAEHTAAYASAVAPVGRVIRSQRPVFTGLHCVLLPGS